MIFLQVALLVTYPLAVHLAVVLDTPELQLLGLVALVTGFLLPGLLTRHKVALTLWVLLVGLAAILFICSAVLYALYLPPILFPLLLFVVFSKTLLPGEEPLVTVIGEASRGPLSDEMRTYTRRVTQMWSLFFFYLVISAFVLPWLFSATTWSLFTNFIHYAITGVLFLGEFVYRKYRFPDHDHPSFIEYIRIVVSSNVRSG